MLNHTSPRSEENAEAQSSLLRPLAILFVIALMLAATMRQPVQAASRERSLRHAAAGRLQLQSMRRMRSFARRQSVGSRSARRTVTRAHASRSVEHRYARATVYTRRSGRRALRGRAGHAHLESVVFNRRALRPMMARPIPGANSLIEAAPGSTPAEPRPDAVTSAAASSPLSASEMASAAIEPRVFPMYSRTGRLIVPAPLRGSREVLVHQNQMADAEGLERIENDEELERLRLTHQLVDIADTSALHVNPELPEDRRSARPWTAKFASDIARAYYARFGQPLELNSAVRTISYQLRLQRVNGNAAAIEGETASPHLTGQAIDFGKHGMSMAEIAWMRLYLEPLMQSGMIDVEEEFQQACFHISVYRSYTGGRTTDLAQVAAPR